MKFARVIGQAVSTKKTGIKGINLLLVRYLDAKLGDTDKTAVCADTVKSRSGDIVLVCTSSSARITQVTRKACIDSAIVGIVETISSKKRAWYIKK
jgi:ethanolamine utilization protein EutN/carbon dioxide concentrating mechanism protein CcmL